MTATTQPATMLAVVHDRYGPPEVLRIEQVEKPVPKDDDGASWELRRQVWNDPRALIGGSDAGAHLDRMCGAPYTTRFLGDCLRGRKLVPLERAVQLITSAPAELFGLRVMGRVMGVVLAADGVAEAVMPLAVGALRDHDGSYTRGFLLLVALAAAGALAVALLPRRARAEA